MEFLNWLKKVFTPQPAGMGRGSDASQSWTLSSSRDDGSDVFNDSYFNGSGGVESDTQAARTAATVEVMAAVAVATESAALISVVA
ncbi:hypothetical protein [Comamonas sp. 26]|uniref:hypothetical protein n=1 Tax=Comamonas sp. 26 TaxID=2035201 RepID=UPI000C40C9AB|nr:hypothetical protein [Comamonas sp. 26]PIG09422.1 hypothetical protein CLU84_2331 [Comamonas sp. 26]